ncbi:MAG TPA: S-methyl-5'-thioadenosine phosphorylase [Actinomycetales bacterium]|nr:S-methyl-5'-thioadenosine phosphorylase [Actinomycetales bacterium]
MTTTWTDPAQHVELADLADIGVIGGSGFYRFLTGAREIRVSTPFGDPSDALTVGEVAGRRVAFVPRHGRGHHLAPHRVNYRANLWALRCVGVRQVLAPCAVGSLTAELTPGAVVVPDQVVDRTWGRAQSVYDTDDGPVVHLPFADPYCPRGRRCVLAAQSASPLSVVDGGTLVVINGPRFSTRAESRWHASAGWSVVGMTGMPEASIARELALCYTSVALVTDLDAGVEAGKGVTHEEVMAVFGRNVEHLKGLLSAAVEGLPSDDGCTCQHVLDGVPLPFELP